MRHQQTAKHVLLIACALLLVVLPIEGSAALRYVALLMTCVGLAWYRRLSRESAEPWLQFPLWPYWLLYAGVAIVGQLWAVAPDYSWREIRNEVVFGALYFWLAFNIVRSNGDMRWLLRMIWAGNLLLVLYSLAIWLSGGQTKDGLVGTINTGVGNFSTYLVTVIPVLAFALYREFVTRSRWRWLFALAFAANFLAMYATENRQSLLAVSAQLVVLSIFVLASNLRRLKVVIPVLLLVCSFVGLFQLQMQHRLGEDATKGVMAALEKDGRLPIWKFSLAEVMQHPLHGGGMGRDSLQRQYPTHPMTQGVFVHAHNMLINRLLQLGFPGLAAFLILLAALAFSFQAGGKTTPLARQLGIVGLAMFVGVFAKNMTDDFFVREQAYLFWFFSGILLGAQSLERVSQVKQGQAMQEMPS